MAVWETVHPVVEAGVPISKEMSWKVEGGRGKKKRDKFMSVLSRRKKMLVENETGLIQLMRRRCHAASRGAWVDAVEEEALRPRGGWTGSLCVKTLVEAEVTMADEFSVEETLLMLEERLMVGLVVVEVVMGADD